uniref:MPN domain-containing protein-like n=1 Tax=Ciona intestinalis TaxID=7719 RepID=UPI0000521B01|nr:MPN domain-containing protein-like [Ciona intestinalis]|eukprot:XP_002122392.1 MPN domain-containing protein-like [Ciona intestinalis]
MEPPAVTNPPANPTPPSNPPGTPQPPPNPEKPMATPAAPVEKEDDDSNADDTESLDSNSSRKDISPRSSRGGTSRSVTLQTLVQEGVLEPGNGVLSIDYLSHKYLGDLLPNGKILWDNVQFPSPSTWATHIKKKINPSKKSGCGWNSVKYKGKKLDKLKANWFRKNAGVVPTHSPAANFDEELMAQCNANTLLLDNKMVRERQSMKYAELKHQTTIDPNTLIEFENFNETNPQPFSIVVSSSVLLLIDFHCHLSTSEVVGYLGGQWDPNKRCLFIIQAFPCKCKLCDQDNAMVVEQEISQNMMRRNLTRVGWYHSHPTSQSEPTIRDIDVQHEMQAMVAATHPAIGLICSPFDVRDATRTESVYSAFWVSPPPEVSEGEVWYGMPMRLVYNEMQDHAIQQDLLAEMRMLVDFHKTQPDLIGFGKLWKGTMTYLDKIKLSMTRKLPKDRSGSQLVHFVHELLMNSTTVNTG